MDIYDFLPNAIRSIRKILNYAYPWLRILDVNCGILDIYNRIRDIYNIHNFCMDIHDQFLE